MTAKAAARDGGVWGVQKAVKSTVEGLAGKPGEIVIGMVSRGKEKPNMADIETPDMDKFISLAYGERAKWLWHGKPPTLRPSPTSHRPPRRRPRPAPNANNNTKTKNTNTNTNTTTTTVTPPTSATRCSSRPPPRPADDDDSPEPAAPAAPSSTAPADEYAGPSQLRKTVFKSVAGRVRDGLRGHSSRPSRDDTPGPGPGSGSGSGSAAPSIYSLAQSSAALTSPAIPGRAFTWKNKPDEYANAFRRADRPEQQPPPPSSSEPAPAPTPAPDTPTRRPRRRGPTRPSLSRWPDEPHEAENNQPGRARATPPAPLPLPSSSSSTSSSVRRPAEAAQRQRRHARARPPARPGGRPLAPPPVLQHGRGGRPRLGRRGGRRRARGCGAGQHQRQLRESPGRGGPQPYGRALAVRRDVGPWVTAELAALEELDGLYGRQQEELRGLHYQLAEAHEMARRAGAEAGEGQRARLGEAIRDVDVLAAKLEYEIKALTSKVGDVEDGARQFERQVRDVERRAAELKVQLETESWPHWFVRTLTGIGTGPNITRGPRGAQEKAKKRKKQEKTRGRGRRGGGGGADDD